MEPNLRLFLLHQLLLSHRRPVPRRVLEQRLGCSRATFKRLLNRLREITRDPIPYDQEANGYAYLEPEKHRSDLPALCLNVDELHALLVIQQQLQQLQPGLLSEVLQPLTRTVSRLLGDDQPVAELARRIRLVPLGQRPLPAHFSKLASAILERRRLRIVYHARGDDRRSERKVSPQRLTLYRGNWYLDAWCHRRDDLRSFAVERIERLEVLDEAAREMPLERVEAHFATSYGIFSGPPRHTAVLHFSPYAARWAAETHWHPKQRGRHLPDGGYELQLPYSDPTELILDILRYGPEVEVIAPEALRNQIKTRLQQALSLYQAEP